MTAPDRPGDRDQQQAAEVMTELMGVNPDEFTSQEREWQRVLAAALAAARAEEAARWQAKIEALAVEFGGLDAEWDGEWVAERIRAVLDGER